MKATLKQIKGCSFVGKAESNHWVTIDTPKESCGNDAASTPMELVLLALAGCSGADIVSILTKKRASFDGFEINIDAQRAEDHPKVFTKIHLEYVFYGKDIKEQDVERSISLSKDKYCSVLAMLRQSVDITTSYKIVK